MDNCNLDCSDLAQLLSRQDIRTVFFVRHRQAALEGKNVEGQDKARPLTELGRQQASALVKSLLPFRFASTAILASDATRTWETASRIARYLPTHSIVLISDEELYRCPMGTFFDRLEGQQDVRHCFMVANNKSLIQLALNVDGQERGFVPGDGYLILAAPADNWKDFHQNLHEKCYAFEWIPPQEATEGRPNELHSAGLRGTTLYNTRVVFRDTG